MMSTQLLIAFSSFAFVASITPGPNNIMLLSSGVNFGFLRTIPHMLGVVLGYSLMVFLVGVGLGSLFTAYPILYSVLRYLSAVYLLYLAWKIAQFHPEDVKTNVAKPLTFFRAASFQWVNPKAWFMAVVAVSTYVPEQNFFTNVIFIAIFSIVFVAPCCVLWTAFGEYFRRYLNQLLHLRIFNITMALLLVFSLYPLFLEA